MSKTAAIHILTGCTAVGKTELALQWAEDNGAEIVSCDSLLFYRGMDIGTAKPSPEELARVPHHLIDLCAPSESMDIARYVELAREAVRAIVDRGRAVLVTGGSGFYLKAFLGPVVDNVVVTDDVRKRVQAMPLEEAVSELRRANPSGLGILDTANPRRVVRALERCWSTGKTLVQLKDDFARQPSAFAGYDLHLVELVRDADDLAMRIRERIEIMLTRGLITEVQQLVRDGFEANPSASRAIGYREVLAMLAGEFSEDQLVDEIAKNTRGLVKKQRTWFRTQLPAHRTVDATTAKAAQLFEDSKLEG